MERETMVSTPADPGAKLAARLAAFPGSGFAVLDGAWFDDLPRLCRGAGLFARSLFLDHADAEVEKAGPWLIALGQAPDATERVLTLVGEEPAAVYWCCAAGEAVLHRHLRTLNMARIPRWAADGGTAPPSDGSGLEPLPVMFRHWDPRVLGATMPVLDPAQFARMLGPAGEIVFLAEDYGGVRRVVADPAFPPAPAGMLTIRSEQIAALNERRLSASHRRIAAYLREVAGSEVGTASDAALHTHVVVSDRVGRGLGLAGEAAHSRWALLMLLSQGRIAGHEPTRAFLTQGGDPPDQQVRHLFDLTIAAMREGRVPMARAR